MLSVRDRAISILEVLAGHPQGLPMSQVADSLGIPRTATHRLLNDLREMGYVRQDREGGAYLLTVKLAALGLSYLSASGITDLAQPVLDRLAASTSELARLAVLDGTDLVWVAKAQGARSGLRYDPDAGTNAYLAGTATGLACLASMPDAQALELVTRQGLRPREDLAPNAPDSLDEVLARVRKAREDGYATAVEAYARGTSAVAVAILRPGTGEPVGTVSLSGPSVRMTPERMAAMSQQLKECAEELAMASVGSAFFAGARRSR